MGLERQGQALAVAPKRNPDKEPKAVLGRSLVFKGELHGEEDLTIEGTFEGSVNLANNGVIIRGGSVVKGDVSGRTIVVEGTVEGNLYAAEQLTLSQSSAVGGSLFAQRIVLEAGCRFNGKIDMESRLTAVDGRLRVSGGG